MDLSTTKFYLYTINKDGTAARQPGDAIVGAAEAVAASNKFTAAKTPCVPLPSPDLDGVPIADALRRAFAGIDGPAAKTLENLADAVAELSSTEKGPSYTELQVEVEDGSHKGPGYLYSINVRSGLLTTLYGKDLVRIGIIPELPADAQDKPAAGRDMRDAIGIAEFIMTQQPWMRVLATPYPKASGYHIDQMLAAMSRDAHLFARRAVAQRVPDKAGHLHPDSLVPGKSYTQVGNSNRMVLAMDPTTLRDDFTKPVYAIDLTTGRPLNLIEHDELRFETSKYQ